MQNSKKSQNSPLSFFLQEFCEFSDFILNILTKFSGFWDFKDSQLWENSELYKCSLFPNLPPYSYDKLTLAQKKTGSSEMATFMLSRASRGCMSKAHQHRDYVLSQ